MRATGVSRSQAYRLLERGMGGLVREAFRQGALPAGQSKTSAFTVPVAGICTFTALFV